MATKCWSSVRGKVVRVTKTDDCCAPVEGPCSTVVSDGFITINYSPEISEGDEIEVKKANGALCVSDKACDSLKWVSVEIEFCNVDPDLFGIITGQPVVTDYEGNSVGLRVGTTINCGGGFGLETWTDIPGALCTPGQKEYGYFAVPCISNGVISDFTIENDAATFTLSGTSRAAQSWGVGPYDVDLHGPGEPGPLLTPFGPNDHMDMHLTNVAPPEATCGCVPLVIEGGPAAPTAASAYEQTDGTGEVVVAWTDPATPAVPPATEATSVRVVINGPGITHDARTVELGEQRLLLGDPATTDHFIPGATYTFTLYGVDVDGNASDTPTVVSYVVPEPTTTP